MQFLHDPICRVAFLSKGLLFNQKLIKTSRREAPDCGAKRRIRAPRARSARGASQLCVSKKSFCFLWIRACTTKRECSPRGRCGFGGVCFSTYPDFHVALFSHIKGTQNKRKHTRHTRPSRLRLRWSMKKLFAVHVLQLY